ncbi:hypothetical protein CK621_04350 [Vandammella animalimorsus]|uniref:Uncharacterized protein n=1 Tax=Vandammella animalimorsus TaxID=2029117 RepID=A0A2A2B026_9BURK|nr:hypothetical protein CK621_04350 [Vandammella animalimorsus]
MAARNPAMQRPSRHKLTSQRQFRISAKAFTACTSCRCALTLGIWQKAALGKLCSIGTYMHMQKAA